MKSLVHGNTGVVDYLGDKSPNRIPILLFDNYRLELTNEGKIDESKLQDAIKARKASVFPKVREIEPKNKEKQEKEYADGSTFKTAPAVRKEGYIVNENHEVHKELQKFDGVSCELVWVTLEGNFKASESKDGSYKGFDAVVYVGVQRTGTFSELPDTPIDIVYSDYKEWDERGVIIGCDFNSLNIRGVVGAKFELTSIANNALKFKLETPDGPVSGLKLEDYEVVNESGAVQAFTFAEDLNNQEYTLSFTTNLTPGKFTVRTKDVVGKPNFYYNGKRAFTIS